MLTTLSILIQFENCYIVTISLFIFLCLEHSHTVWGIIRSFGSLEGIAVKTITYCLLIKFVKSRRKERQSEVRSGWS